MDGWIAKVDGSSRAMSGMDGAVIVTLKAISSLLSGLNYVQGGFNAFQSGLAGIFSGIAESAVIHMAPMKELLLQVSKLPGPMGDNAKLGFAAVSAAMSAAANVSNSYSQIQKEQEQDFVRNSQAIENVQHKLGDLIGKLQHAKVAQQENVIATRENTSATETFGKSILDMGIRVGNGFGAIKGHTQKVDIKDVMDRSADAASRLAQVNTQAVEPSFVVIGRAAEDAARKVNQTTTAMNIAMSNPWATSFTRGNLLTPGAGGFTISLPQQAMAGAPQFWGSTQSGWQMSSTGTPYRIGHSGGAINWASVQRFHKGGMIDEVPIMAQTGEGVLSRRGMAALSALNNGNPTGMGGSTIYVTVHAGGAFFDTPESRERLGRIAGDALMARLKMQGGRV
jgi:hypothetical protein